METLKAAAADAKATFAERLAAAKALKGRSAANPATGSAELDLLARGTCPTADEVSKPYFVEARRAFAACASDDTTRERILSAAIAAEPGNDELRIEYVWAAFGSGQDARALMATEPILQGSQYYSQNYSEGYGSEYGDAEAGPQRLPVLASMKPEDSSKLFWWAIHAREKRHESDEALTLVRSALSSEKAVARQHILEEEQKRLEAEAARRQENEARAPKIHAELDQDRVVRPRLLPGMPFTPRKRAVNEGDAE
jgi:hypothetical protein